MRDGTARRSWNTPSSERRLWWRWLLVVLFAVVSVLAIPAQWIRVEVVLGKPFGGRIKVTLREDVVHIMWLTSDARYDGLELNVSGHLGSTRIERGRYVASSTDHPIGYERESWVSHLNIPTGLGTVFVLFLLAWFAWLPIGLELRAQRRRRLAGLCPKCRYPRTGLPVGTACPECGHRERLVEEDRSKS